MKLRGRLLPVIALPRLHIGGLHLAQLCLDARILGVRETEAGERSHSFLQRSPRALLKAELARAGKRHSGQVPITSRRRIRLLLDNVENPFPKGAHELCRIDRPDAAEPRYFSIPSLKAVAPQGG